ncbi:MAG: alkane 1-monooxygenase [Pseudomonadota bacterium]
MTTRASSIAPLPVAAFAGATLACYGLLGLAATTGGVWVWGALLYVTVFVFALDGLVAGAADAADEGAEFPAARSLLKILGLLHFTSFILLIWAMRLASDLGGGAQVGLVIATGLVMGQIAHPVAHELIHARPAGLRALGRLIYASMLAGHHASAHLRLHHVHVGTRRDPNTPRPGEGFYRYALRASRDSFLGGLIEENRLHRGPLWRHPYAVCMAAGLVVPAGAWMVSGLPGLLSVLVVALHAQIQILMSDYVQHYGLPRQCLPDGTLEPLGPHHAWNAPHAGSSALTLNATRHSHHHMEARVPFPALRLDADRMPVMPHPLPVMAALALSPTLWRRVMDPLSARWRHRDWHAMHTPVFPATGQRNVSGQAAQALAQADHDSFAPHRPAARARTERGVPDARSDHTGTGRDGRSRV